MVYTFNNIFLIHTLYCLFNHGLVAVLDDAGQLPGPQGTELLLYLREHELYGIVLRRIGYVEDAAEAQPLHLRPRLLALVGGEVVHKDADLVFAICFAQPRHVLDELRYVD